NMPESLNFLSPEQKQEQETKEQLAQEGGIVHTTRPDPETEEKKQFVNILGVEIETHASKEDIQTIKEELILSELDQEMLRTIAESYKANQAVMLEGDPGSGKTFLLKQFVKMIHGKDAPTLEIVCSPGMTELDILGQWTPKAASGDALEEYERYLNKFMNSARGQELSRKFHDGMEELVHKANEGEISTEEFQKEFSSLSDDHLNTQRQALTNFFQQMDVLDDDTDWEFQKGPLLQAYDSREGRGYPLIVDEFNLMPSNYQQIFLKIGGQSGGLADTISVPTKTSQTQYNRGQDTWIGFTANFPEKTEGRSTVSPPMTDRVVWHSIPEDRQEDKRRDIALTAGGRLDHKVEDLLPKDPDEFSVPATEGIDWTEVLDGKLGEQIAEIVYILDKAFVSEYKQVGDKISTSEGTRERTQQLEFSQRNMARLYNYLDHFQVRDPETGRIDFTETLRNAFARHYVNKILDDDLRERAWLKFEEEMTGDTGRISVPDPEADFQETVDSILRGDNMPEDSVVKTKEEYLDYLVEKIEKEEDTGDLESGEKITFSRNNTLKAVINRITDESESLQESDTSISQEDAIRESAAKLFDDRVSEIQEVEDLKNELKKSLTEILNKSQNEVVVDLADSTDGSYNPNYAQILGMMVDNIPTSQLVALSHFSTPVNQSRLEDIKAFVDSADDASQAATAGGLIGQGVIDGSADAVVESLVDPKTIDKALNKLPIGQVTEAVWHQNQEAKGSGESSLSQSSVRKQLVDAVLGATLGEEDPQEGVLKGLTVVGKGGAEDEALEQVNELLPFPQLIVMDLDARPWNPDWSPEDGQPTPDVRASRNIDEGYGGIIEDLVAANLDVPIVLTSEVSLNELKDSRSRRLRTLIGGEDIVYTEKPIDVSKLMTSFVKN
ncbi:MAG: hypothetical protein BRC25_01180, partial [Parcubacteria group bacterium SW_6_46_9]